MRDGLGSDFLILWLTGHRILEGHSPYSVNEFYYPGAMGLFMAIWALLPAEVSFILWTSLHVIMLTWIFRRKTFFLLMSYPVAYVFIFGQVEWVFFGLERSIKGSGWRPAITAALITIKPQDAFFLLPFHLLGWLRQDRATLKKFLAATTVIYGVPLLLWGYSDWVRNVSQSPQSHIMVTPGLWSLGPSILVALLAIGMIIYGIGKSKGITKSAFFLASPSGLHYTQYQLIDLIPAKIFVPLSWAVQALSPILQNYSPYILLPLCALVIQRSKSTSRNHSGDVVIGSSPQRSPVPVGAPQTGP